MSEKDSFSTQLQSTEQQAAAKVKAQEKAKLERMLSRRSSVFCIIAPALVLLAVMMGMSLQEWANTGNFDVAIRTAMLGGLFGVLFGLLVHGILSYLTVLLKD